MPARAVVRDASPVEADDWGITEVAARVGVKPHVVRYWETEFPVLRPPTGGAKRRRYSAADVALLEQIKHMLYTERLTVAGVRRRLSALRRADRRPTEWAGDAGRLRATLLGIREEIAALRARLG